MAHHRRCRTADDRLHHSQEKYTKNVDLAAEYANSEDQPDMDFKAMFGVLVSGSMSFEAISAESLETSKRNQEEKKAAAEGRQVAEGDEEGETVVVDDCDMFADDGEQAEDEDRPAKASRKRGSQKRVSPTSGSAPSSQPGFQSQSATPAAKKAKGPPTQFLLGSKPSATRAGRVITTLAGPAVTPKATGKPD